MMYAVFSALFRLLATFVVGWLLLGGSLSNAKTKDAKVQQYIQEALTYHSDQGTAQDTTKALTLYNAALKLNPDRIDALLNAAQILYARGKYKNARAFYTQAVRSARTKYKDKPQYEAQALTGLGICYQKEGKIQDAIKMYRRAKQKHRPFIEAHYNLINLLIMEKQFDAVEAALAEAKKVAPSPLYDRLNSRVKGREGTQILGSNGLQIVVVGLVGGILLTLVLKRLRKRSTTRVRLTGTARRKNRRSGRSPNRRI